MATQARSSFFYGDWGRAPKLGVDTIDCMHLFGYMQHRVPPCMQIALVENRQMMLSFVPKLDLSRVAVGNPFRKFIHRCFVQLDPATTTVDDIIRTASSELGAHLQLRSAYTGEPSAPVKIVSVWASQDGPI